MALFDRNRRRDGDGIISSSPSDAATRALSVTAVENDFVEGVYEKLASWYDWFFGPTLHPGRLQAIQRMGIEPGDRVLEVGVGTGINAALYPRDCSVTGVDLSAVDAREGARAGRAARASPTSACSRWTRPTSKFADDSFDIVYAPYLISVVPDPVRSRARCAACAGRRPDHLPESLPQPELLLLARSSGSSRRSPCTSASSPTSTCPRSSRRPTSAGLDREGERPADLVARDVHQA